MRSILSPSTHEPIHADVSAPEPAHYAEPVHAEVHPAPDELTSLVADLESSIGDAFPAAPPVVEPHSAPGASLGTQPSSGRGEKLSGWPGAHAPQSAPAVPKFEHEVAAPAAATSAATSGTAASTSGAATAASATAASATVHSRGTVRPLPAAAATGQSPDGVDLLGDVQRTTSRSRRRSRRRG